MRPRAPHIRSASRAFEDAWRSSQATGEQCYRIAGQAIRLRFAGGALTPHVAPALAHLAVGPETETDLTIGVWESRSTRVAFPPPPRGTDGAARPGEIRLYSEGERCALYREDHQTLSLVDFPEKQAYFQASDLARIPQAENAFPLQTIFHHWFSHGGHQLVHAAAVGTRAGAVLLAGKGGSGKSTTALACLRAGLFYLADDYTLVSNEPFPMAHSLYCSAKLQPENLRRFPELRPLVRPAGSGDASKALLYLHEDFLAQLPPSLPIKAIVHPRVGEAAGSSWSRLSPAMALLALAPSTIFQLPGAGASAFDRLARLVGQVPSYRLDAGTDLNTIAPAIEHLLREASYGG